MSTDRSAGRFKRFLRIFMLTRTERRCLRDIHRSGFFDPVYYRGAYPQIHPWFHRFGLRHYIVYGETRGYRPNPDFSPAAYLRYNPDIAASNVPAFHHWVTSGHKEARLHKELPKVDALPEVMALPPSLDPDRPKARHAIVMHVYYPDLWPEFAATLDRLTIDFDLYVTLTYRGDETEALAKTIQTRYPQARVMPLTNRGRDILPFMTLLNSGVLDGYEAICKIHTKKSPHREDGDKWRRHLIDGILPQDDLSELLELFKSDESAAFWVADGQHYNDVRWWGSNLGLTTQLMLRLEYRVDGKRLSFPAGSIYWMKPLIAGQLKALKLFEAQFEAESAQVDGTLAHALERTMGCLADAGGQRIVQTAQLRDMQNAPVPAPDPRPSFVSAFYLPQFHPIPENDNWWGKGFTEWRGAVNARPLFDGHQQPALPTDLGFYDLRVTEVMGDQAALAQKAGIDAFCVYHYWFDGQRVLETPLERLLKRPEIDFPFYLCWANESWRRNWDGLSGTVLLEQTYRDGFEAGLVESTLPYMRDARYMRPDGTRPRFVIYRPEDMPDPAASIARLREAWRSAGIGEVELGAVCFHIDGENPVADDLFDFWIEMPPHGLVSGEDYLFGGPEGNLIGASVQDDFKGLIYDYNKVIDNSISRKYTNALPANTICGIMPSWDNTARRGLSAHIAHGASPARFYHWLRLLRKFRLGTSYRRELFVNAWNEWAEKAMMEPSKAYGDLNLRMLEHQVRGTRPNQKER